MPLFKSQFFYTIAYWYCLLVLPIVLLIAYWYCLLVLPIGLPIVLPIGIACCIAYRIACVAVGPCWPGVGCCPKTF